MFYLSKIVDRTFVISNILNNSNLYQLQLESNELICLYCMKYVEKIIPNCHVWYVFLLWWKKYQGRKKRDFVANEEEEFGRKESMKIKGLVCFWSDFKGILKNSRKIEYEKIHYILFENCTDYKKHFRLIQKIFLPKIDEGKLKKILENWN